MNEVSPRDRRYRFLISAFLVIVLGAQGATIAFTAVRSGLIWSRLYPIIEYPMYAEAHYEGERVTGRWILHGVLASGGQVNVSEDTLNISFWDYNFLVGSAVKREPNAIEHMIQVVRERDPRAKEFTALVVENYPMKLSRNGGTPIPSEVVLSVSM
jgi:hypothetical protein